MTTCEDCIETHNALEQAPDCAGCCAVRPDVAAILDQDIVEHGELWKELARS